MGQYQPHGCDISKRERRSHQDNERRVRESGWNSHKVAHRQVGSGKKKNEHKAHALHRETPAPPRRVCGSGGGGGSRGGIHVSDPTGIGELPPLYNPPPPGPSLLFRFPLSHAHLVTTVDVDRPYGRKDPLLSPAGCQDDPISRISKS